MRGENPGNPVRLGMGMRGMDREARLKLLSLVTSAEMMQIFNRTGLAVCHDWLV